MLLPLSLLLALSASLSTALAVEPAANPRRTHPSVARGLVDGILNGLGLGGGPSQEMIDAYLAATNSVRSAHGADDLSWNGTLSDAASSWAASCQVKHSDGALLDGTPYGENVVAGTGHFPVADAMQQFVLDESDFDGSTLNHFTQVVWKATTQLGCAVAQCPGVFDSGATASYYVCLYYPPGNVIGEVA
ncbi:CAP domain-containing protein [Mycena filopes]|nr:CAP domain-containing protein [Mycena filopes]